MVNPLRDRANERTPWTEKYRPSSLDEIGLCEQHRAIAQAWVDGTSRPHLVLSGPPGCGKTTLVKILSSQPKIQLLDVDGSMDRGIEMIQGTVSRFVRVFGARGFHKVVFFDEADGVTRPAQAALHQTMEKHSKRVSFLFTCNHLDKIDEPIQSRCVVMRFEPISIEKRKHVLSRVLDAEGLSAPDTTLHMFVSRFTDLRKMIQSAEVSFATQGALVVPPAPDGSPRLLGEIMNDPEYSATVPYDWEPYTAKSRLTLLAGSPKTAGKSTLARYYAAAKVIGGTFLGQNLEAGPVLWVGPDEYHLDTARCFAELVSPSALVSIWDRSPDIAQIAQEATKIGAKLVVLDTLPRIARVTSENDNSNWTAWSERALPLIRKSGAVWLAIHHHRKAGGGGGLSIRGGSAIFAFVDVGLSLLPIAGSPTSRKLVVEGSRFGLPGARLIRLTDDGYVDQGAAVAPVPGGPSTRQELLLEVLGEYMMTVPQLHKRLVKSGVECSDQTVRADLDALSQLGLVSRLGSGKRGDPYHYIQSLEDL